MDLSTTQAKVLAAIGKYPGVPRNKLHDRLDDISKSAASNAVGELKDHSLVVEDVSTGWVESAAGERTEIVGSSPALVMTGKGKHQIREHLTSLLEEVVELENGANGFHYVPEHARDEAHEPDYPTDPDHFRSGFCAQDSEGPDRLWIGANVSPKEDETPEEMHQRMVSKIVHSDYERDRRQLIMERGNDRTMDIRVVSAMDDNMEPVVLVGFFSRQVDRGEALDLWRHDGPFKQEG